MISNRIENNACTTVSDLGIINSSNKAYNLVKGIYKDINCGLISTLLLDSQKRLIGVLSLHGNISDAWIKINDYASSVDECSGIVVLLTKNEGKRSDFTFAGSLLSLKNALMTSERELIDVIVCGTYCYYSYADDRLKKFRRKTF